MNNGTFNLTVRCTVLLVLSFFTYDSPLAAKEINFAFSYDIPPFVMEKGTSGLEIEIVREALKHNGHTFTVLQCSYKRLQIAVKRMESVDAAAAVRKTEDDGTYYSDNFVLFKNYAITKKSSGITLNNISDLKGKRIVAWQNAHRDLGEEFASLFSPDVKAPHIKRYQEIPVQKKQVWMFWLGKQDVIVIDESIFLWFTKQLSLETTIGDEPVYHEIFQIPTEFQVNFNSEKIRDDFNEGLIHIRQNGVYQQIHDKYLR